MYHTVTRANIEAAASPGDSQGRAARSLTFALFTHAAKNPQRPVGADVVA